MIRRVCFYFMFAAVNSSLIFVLIFYLWQNVVMCTAYNCCERAPRNTPARYNGVVFAARTRPYLAHDVFFSSNEVSTVMSLMLVVTSTGIWFASSPSYFSHVGAPTWFDPRRLEHRATGVTYKRVINHSRYFPSESVNCFLSRLNDRWIWHRYTKWKEKLALLTDDFVIDSLYIYASPGNVSKMCARHGSRQFELPTHRVMQEEAC